MPVTSFSDKRAEEFRLEVRRWAKEAVTPEFRRVHDMTEDEQATLRRAWDAKLYEAGYAGLSWPKEFGGGGEGVILEAILLEELAAAHAPEGFGRIGRVIAGPSIMAQGTDDQRRRLLPGILNGTQIWCLGLSEPHAGSDLPSITTRAKREGDTYHVHGRKIWTSHAHHADRCLLLTRTDREAPTDKAMSMFLLDMRQKGVQVSRIITAAGDHHFNEVLLDDALVHESDRLGDENDGWRVFRASLAFERGVGVAFFHYIDMRRQCDVALNCCARSTTVPAALDQAKSLSAAIEVVRWHAMRIAELEAAGKPSTSVQNVLKVYFSETWQKLTTFGMRCGCAEHEQLWQYQYMRSRASTIYSGTSEIQRNTIARRLRSSV